MTLNAEKMDTKHFILGEVFYIHLHKIYIFLKLL